MSWKDQARRKRQSQRRGRRGARRAQAEVLRRVWGPAGRAADDGLFADDPAAGTDV